MSKRNKVKYPALTKNLNPKIRQEYIDYDYIDQLNEEEKAWLNKFSEEFINAKFNNDETDIDKSKEGRKAAYDRNNARNRCLYGQLKTRHWKDNKLVNYDDVLLLSEQENTNDALHINDMESSYVEFLDFKELEDILSEYDDAMSLFTEAHE